MCVLKIEGGEGVWVFLLDTDYIFFVNQRASSVDEDDQKKIDISPKVN